MQRITPHLWFDKEAKQAAEFYTSLLPDSNITNITTLHDTPSGDCDVVSFGLSGQAFMAISAGPLFKFNPSVSFHVKCRTKDEVDVLWKKLSAGGTVLMELSEYPWSEKYGWTQDKYGLSWQVIFVGGELWPQFLQLADGLSPQVVFVGESGVEQKITPALMFVGDVCGKAEEAVNFYTSVFPNAKVEDIVRYGKGEEPDKEGSVKYAGFTLAGQEFRAMDSAYEHLFAFNEAISFIVRCDTQQEIDHYWDTLSAVPEAEQCGWLKDKYGLSWQIVPTAMDAMMQDTDEKKIARVTEAFLKMKKFDITELEKAYQGR